MATENTTTTTNTPAPYSNAIYAEYNANRAAKIQNPSLREKTESMFNILSSMSMNRELAMGQLAKTLYGIDSAAEYKESGDYKAFKDYAADMFGLSSTQAYALRTCGKVYTNPDDYPEFVVRMPSGNMQHILPLISKKEDIERLKTIEKTASETGITLPITQREIKDFVEWYRSTYSTPESTVVTEYKAYKNGVELRDMFPYTVDLDKWKAGILTSVKSRIPDSENTWVKYRSPFTKAKSKRLSFILATECESGLISSSIYTFIPVDNHSTYRRNVSYTDLLRICAENQVFLKEQVLDYLPMADSLLQEPRDDVAYDNFMTCFIATSPESDIDASAQAVLDTFAASGIFTYTGEEAINPETGLLEQ